MSDIESRPHRSRRQRPCDRCRSRKTACVLAGRRPCRSCERAGVQCTFVAPPTTRLRYQRQEEIASGPSDEFNMEGAFAGGDEGQLQGSDTYGATDPGSAISLPGAVNFNETEPHQSPIWTFSQANRAAGSPLRPNQGLRPLGPADISQIPLDSMSATFYDPGIQHIRSIETLDQSNVQLCGTSAELDPWLLRHCKFDDVGMRSYGKIRIRNVGGVPVNTKVPVHFTVVDDAFHEPIGPRSTSLKTPEVRRAELNALVPPDMGLKLIALYFKFVFPELPIVSRHRTDLLTSNAANGFSGFPVMLLAAIYASAFPFSVHEPSLQLSTAFDGLPIDALWSLAYELIIENIHRPKLAVVQAALLFMQQPPGGRTQALNDNPVTWSFWASILGLSNSLGLHLECRRWGIPTWEKRLRRRLWWAIYIEDTWRSFLSGRPPFIHIDEWDVSDLDDTDFVHNIAPVSALRRPPVSTASVGRCCIFPHVVRLTLLVAEIYQNFYTLKASQNLSCDFHASIDTAKPLRVKLQSWYSSLPDHFRININNTAHQSSWKSPSRDGIAVLQFCYLIAEVLLYRAILRSITRSPPLAIITGGEEEEGDEDYLSLIDRTSWEDLFTSNFDLDQLPPATAIDSSAALEATLNVAEKCGGIVTHFVKDLGHEDFDALWYGWIRLCLATMSNFVTLLLVQAPDAARAAKAKSLWKLWLGSLQRQYKHNSPLFMLGLVRLNSWPLADLDKFFEVPAHVSQAIVGDRPLNGADEDFLGWSNGG